MKKTYIKPSLEAYNVRNANIIATSNISGGQSNTYGPKVADGKGGFFDDDEEEW